MFLKNTADRNIKLTSFEGYSFVIPPGVSWIWDKAGEHLVVNIYKQEGVNGKWGFQGSERVFIPQSHTIPAITASNEKEWIKGGKRLSEVERFRINYAQFPNRSYLITLAQKRGVASGQITELLADQTIDGSVITEVINNLPIPDEIKFPKEKIEEIKE